MKKTHITVMEKSDNLVLEIALWQPFEPLLGCYKQAAMDHFLRRLFATVCAALPRLPWLQLAAPSTGKGQLLVVGQHGTNRFEGVTCFCASVQPAPPLRSHSMYCRYSEIEHEFGSLHCLSEIVASTSAKTSNGVRSSGRSKIRPCWKISKGSRRISATQRWEPPQEAP